MLIDIPIEDILFLDIETVPAQPSYQKLDQRFQQLWDKKASQIAAKPDDTPESIYKKAGIYAEFGKIICIVAGFISFQNNQMNLRMKTFSGDDEKKLLSDFFELLNQHFSNEKFRLCAHNGKEFDYPYLCRRGLINGLKIPRILNLSGKKPWEVPHLDTMELWKFGDYKSYTSLDLLTASFGIPTPKDDISGADVGDVYWIDHNLERIVSYCCKDVVSVVQIYLCFNGLDLLTNQQVIIVD